VGAAARRAARPARRHPRPPGRGSGRRRPAERHRSRPRTSRPVPEQGAGPAVTALAPEILPAQVPDGTGWPGPDTVVLLHRPLRPGTDTAGLARFSDDRWPLDPAVFEDHAKARSLNFALVPQALRLEAKHYVWQLLNHQESRAMPRAAA